MQFADFVCRDCGYKFDVCKMRVLDNFSDMKELCPQCKSKNTGPQLKVAMHDVAAGKCGNSETGYSTGVTYHPSTVGKVKGTKIKKR
jgi:hypothetical protein